MTNPGCQHKKIMDKYKIEYLKELNDRLYARGFSWHHEDYFQLQEALPEILKLLKGEGKMNLIREAVKTSIKNFKFKEDVEIKITEEKMPKCKGCGKEIKWVVMASGAKMPLDAKPVQMIQVKEGIGESIPVYMPHWATCEKAKDFKR